MSEKPSPDSAEVDSEKYGPWYRPQSIVTLGAQDRGAGAFQGDSLVKLSEALGV